MFSNLSKYLKEISKDHYYKLFSYVVFVLSILSVGFLVFKIGSSEQEKKIHYFFSAFFYSVQLLLFLSLLIRLIILKNDKTIKRVFYSEIIFVIAIFLYFLKKIIFREFFEKFLDSWDVFFESVYIISINALIFLIEFSKVSGKYFKKINPATLLIFSFISLIVFGALFLLLPDATTKSISITDAFFTSTSAVCVTGLTTLDTATHFTLFGKIIIMILIQLGGLGIMTFTSFFGFFFARSSSFSNYLIAKEILGNDTFSDMFRTLFKIIIFTLIIETVGAFFIFLSVNKDFTTIDNLIFSVFHSVSAFCNAGFSTKTLNLMDPVLIDNYFFQTNIAFLIILGGIGFPFLLNAHNLVKHYLANFSRRMNGFKYVHRPRIININSRIVFFTTLILIFSGIVFFMLFEYNNTLKGHNFFEKIMISFFSSVTPRTAGFNTFDYGKILPITCLFTIFLMWVGASPAGTGGGIKTTTFVISIFNTIGFIKGKNRTEISGREFSDTSIQKAYATIFLSILTIGLGILMLNFFNPEFGLMKSAFECFSAFGTVGLSMGITSSLAMGSKWVLIVLMFLGRVSVLSFLGIFVHKVSQRKYKLPVEEVIIT